MHGHTKKGPSPQAAVDTAETTANLALLLSAYSSVISRVWFAANTILRISRTEGLPVRLSLDQ
jgi:hypothetical protein